MLRSILFSGVFALVLVSASFTAAWPAAYPPQPDYAAFHASFTRPVLDASRTTAVEHRVVQRGPARFELSSGRLTLGRPVGGRTCVAVFTGSARFILRVPEGPERDELARRTGADSIARDCGAIVFVFADSTPAELARLGSFGPGTVSNAAQDAVTDCFRYIGEPRTRYLDAGLARAFLEGRENGHFMAYIPFSESDRMMFELDPTLLDGALLWREARRHRVGLSRRFPLELVCQFAPGTAAAAPAARADSAIGGLAAPEPPLRVHGYDIAVSVTREMRFRAAATLDCEAHEDSAGWFAFELFRDLVVDSVRWEGAPAAAVYKHPQGNQLWVRAGRPLARGEHRSLRISYHGPLFENAGDWIFVRSDRDWYPRATQGGDATFDVTFRVPDELLVVGTGRRLEQSDDRGERRERWVTPAPVADAAFLVGRFREMQLRPDAPRQVIGLVFTGSPGRFVVETDQPDGTTRQTMLRPTVDERVIEDMTQAAGYYTGAFGMPHTDALWLAAASKGEGQSWPGVVNASWGARLEPPFPWEDEFARARLVARQWWGEGVAPRTRRDQWITEGLAAFSALRYLEARNPRHDVAAELFERWRLELVGERLDRARGRSPAAPIGLGNRSSSFEQAGEYDRIIALKGAWVMQMLRAQLSDPSTRDDRSFNELLREVYAAPDGRISTAELRRAAERHAGRNLSAFFQQWVYRTEIPRVRCAWRRSVAPDGAHAVECRIMVAGMPAALHSPLDVRVDLGGGRSVRDRIAIDAPLTETTLRGLPAPARGVSFNDGEGLLGVFETVSWQDRP